MMRELSLHILDVLQNSREAGSRRVWLTVEEDLARDTLTVEVRDDGRGMSEETMCKATDPFFTTRTTRHVGLGLPLFAAAAKRCNGALACGARRGTKKGTRITASFQYSHVDRPPLGDLSQTLMTFLLGEPACDLIFVHRKDGRAFSLDTRTVRRQIRSWGLGHPGIRTWLRERVSRGEAGLQQAPAPALAGPSPEKEVWKCLESTPWKA